MPYFFNLTRSLQRVALKTQPEILEQYDQVIKEQLESGVVEEVRQDQVLELIRAAIGVWIIIMEPVGAASGTIIVPAYGPVK